MRRQLNFVQRFMLRMNNRRKRTCVAVLLIWMVMVMPAIARCTADLAFYNLNRRIRGEVNVECPGGLHSVPYGNWGVDSNFESRKDANQFPGWKPDGNSLEWNSCTRLRPPNHYFQPGAVPPEQWANPDVAAVYAVMRHNSPPGHTCESWLPGQLYSLLGRLYMNIYELDRWDRDDLVATLSYGTVNIPLTCNGPWNCTGWSTVRSPSSGNAVVTADIRVYVRLYKR